jgi:hypothetical protein
MDAVTSPFLMGYTIAENERDIGVVLLLLLADVVHILITYDIGLLV